MERDDFCRLLNAGIVLHDDVIADIELFSNQGAIALTTRGVRWQIEGPQKGLHFPSTTAYSVFEVSHGEMGHPPTAPSKAVVVLGRPPADFLRLDQESGFRKFAVEMASQLKPSEIAELLARYQGRPGRHRLATVKDLQMAHLAVDGIPAITVHHTASSNAIDFFSTFQQRVPDTTRLGHYFHHWEATLGDQFITWSHELVVTEV